MGSCVIVRKHLLRVHASLPIKETSSCQSIRPKERPPLTQRMKQSKIQTGWKGWSGTPRAGKGITRVDTNHHMLLSLVAYTFSMIQLNVCIISPVVVLSPRACSRTGLASTWLDTRNIWNSPSACGRFWQETGRLPPLQARGLGAFSP